MGSGRAGMAPASLVGLQLRHQGRRRSSLVGCLPFTSLPLLPSPCQQICLPLQTLSQLTPLAPQPKTALLLPCPS